MTRRAEAFTKGRWTRANKVERCSKCNAYFAQSRFVKATTECGSCKGEKHKMANVITARETGTGGGAWAHLPADVYDAVLESYEERIRPLDQFNDDPDAMRLTLKFRLDDLPGSLLETLGEGAENPVYMLHWVNKTLSAKANLAPVLDALGIAWGPGEATDLDDMPGKRCRLVVGRKTPQGKTEEIAFIQSVVPAKAVTPDAPSKTKKAAPSAGSDTCDVEGCAAPVNSYTKRGKALCSSHDAEDL